MRGILSVDDWFKLAAGILAGLFVLSVAWVYMANFVSSECWKDTIKPFDENLLGTRSLQTPLGSKDSFVVPLNLDKSCLQEIFFIHGEFLCSDKCELGINEHWYRWDDKLSSSTVESCKEDCAKYCAGKECILLMPKPPGISTGFIAFNKPRVYGSGENRFQWDSKWDRLTIKPDSEEKCIVFKRLGDEKTYSVEPTANTGECE